MTFHFRRTIAFSCAAIVVASIPAFANRAYCAAHQSIYAAAGNPDDDDKEVTSTEIDKYVATYKAMRQNRAMTVEQAAAKQGMTIAQFRDLENRIERDDAVRERVRKLLRPDAGAATKTD